MSDRAMACRKGALLLTAAAAFVVLGAAPALAQRGGGGSPSKPVASVQVTDLVFGMVIAGTPTTVVPAGAGSAQFEVEGPPNAPLGIAFSLPAQLSATGGATLPVSFGPQSAAWAPSNQPTQLRYFDPTVGTQVTLPGNRSIFVYLGGRVNPPAAQPGGSFQGNVTLSVTPN